MASFCNMLSISICTWYVWSKFMWGVSWIFCWTGFLLKDLLHPSTSFKIFESFVSIFHVSIKCFNLPASGNIGISLAGNNFLINGWKFSYSLVGITCENDMLNKVSFLFVFTLSIAAALLLISTKTLLLPRLTKTILFEEEFLHPSRACPWCLWWAIWKELLFCSYPFQKTVRWFASVTWQTK